MKTVKENYNSVNAPLNDFPQRTYTLMNRFKTGWKVVQCKYPHQHKYQKYIDQKYSETLCHTFYAIGLFFCISHIYAGVSKNY